MEIVAIEGDRRGTRGTVIPVPRSKTAAFRSAGKFAPKTLISLEDGDWRAKTLTPASTGVVPMRDKCASIPNSSYPPQNQRPSMVFPSRERNRASRHSVGLPDGSLDAGAPAG